MNLIDRLRKAKEDLAIRLKREKLVGARKVRDEFYEFYESETSFRIRGFEMRGDKKIAQLASVEGTKYIYEPLQGVTKNPEYIEYCKNRNRLLGQNSCQIN